MKSVEERRQQLKAAISEQWEYELREDPEFATMIGDYRCAMQEHCRTSGPR